MDEAATPPAPGAGAPGTVTVATTTDRSGLVQRLHDATLPELEFWFSDDGPGPDELALVAWLDEEPVGYLLATMPPGGQIDIWEHGVIPTARHHGIGKRLLGELARRAGSGRRLHVDPAHVLDPDRTRDYYSQFGFRREGGEMVADADEVGRRTGTT